MSILMYVVFTISNFIESERLSGMVAGGTIGALIGVGFILAIFAAFGNVILENVLISAVSGAAIGMLVGIITLEVVQFE